MGAGPAFFVNLSAKDSYLMAGEVFLKNGKLLYALAYLSLYFCATLKCLAADYDEIACPDIVLYNFCSC
jgi:hypothetical protein